MALTTHIEAGFQRQLKPGNVFVDLTAAYDTVWKEGFLLKFGETVGCSKLFAFTEQYAVKPFLPRVSWRSLQ
jgi:hypothetical protein